MEEPSAPVPAADSEVTSDAEHDYLWQRRAQALERAEISVLYHRRRERFFDVLDRGNNFLTILTGSAAAYQIIGTDTNKTWAATFALIGSATSALALTFSVAERARRHASLAQQFARLIAEITERGPRGYQEEELCKWEATIRMIEIDEPAPYPVEQALAQYDYGRTVGKNPEPIHWLRRLIGKFVAIQPESPTKVPHVNSGAN